MTDLAYNRVTCIASIADPGEAAELAWEMMGRVVQRPCDISNQTGDSGGFPLKIGDFDRQICFGFVMFLVCLLRLWEIMGNDPARLIALYIVSKLQACGVF
ncbi:MAG: hypothetical protein ACEPO2_02660 [Pelagibaca sp.]